MGTNSEQDLMKQYRSSINQNILNQFTQVKEINDKYQLSSGTEDDFNNAALFLFYSQTKNTSKIDNAENNFSEKFGQYLTKYYDSYLTNEDIAILANYIHYYNKQIDDKYTFKNITDSDAATKIQSIMADIYGLNSQTFEIKENSYAYKLLESVKKNYVETIANNKLAELNEKVLTYLFNNSSRPSNATLAEKDRLNEVFKNIISLYINQYKTKYGLYPTYSVGTYYYVITDTDFIKYNGTNNRLSAAEKVEYYHWNHSQSAVDCDYYTLNNSVWTLDTSHGLGFVQTIINTLFTATISGAGFSSVEANSSVQGTTNVTQYYLDQIFNESTQNYDYSYDTYEKDFLILIAYDYILTKISGTGLTILKAEEDYNYSTDTDNRVRADYTMNKYVVENSDANTILYNDLSSGESMIAKNYTVKIGVSSEILNLYKTIAIGNLHEPYYIEQNVEASSINNKTLDYYDASDNLISSTIDGQSISTVTLNIFNTTNKKYFENTRTAYYTLNIQDIYYNYPSIAKIKFHDSNIVLFDRSSLDITNIIYENEITNLYYNYFRPLSNTEAYSMSPNQSNPYQAIISSNNVYHIADYLYLDGDNKISYKSYIEYQLSKDVDADGSFDAELKIMKNTFKIFYEFAKPTTLINDTSTLTELATYEKRHSDSYETYNALSYVNLNYFTLNNIVIEKNSPEYTIFKTLYDDKYSNSDYKDYGFETINHDKYTVISLNIIYKELNTEIRLIDCSDIQNRLLGEYIASSGNNNVITTDLYDAVQTAAFMNDIDSENQKLFLSLHTNDYIIRSGASDDLIAYLAGEYINYGLTSSSKQDIEEIKRIYKEVRDFFYTVLLNKAFTIEELYDVYKQIYIKAYTIERFMSSRLDNIKNIDLYTTSDCRNFLISYGLKILSDQVDKYDFNNSLVYKKRLIANYNELMSQKGSKAVMEKFFEIFNYDTTEIEIYKYLLMKLNTLNSNNTKIESSEINFIPIPYTTTNISAAIDEYKNKSKPYNDFIAKDKYWSSDDLSSDDVNTIMESPVNTKYLGIDFKKDIYMSYIKSKYVLSLNDYLYDSLFYEKNASVERYYNGLVTQTGLFEKEIGVVALYKLTKLLFAQYIYLNEHYDAYRCNSTSDVTVDLSNLAIGASATKSFYGINKLPYIGKTSNNFGFFTTTFLNETTLKDLFKCPYIKYVDNKYKFSSDETTPDYIDYYIYTNNIKPFSLTYNTTSSDTIGGTNYTNTITEVLFGKNNSGIIASYGGELPYIIPLSLSNATNYTISTKTFDNFQHSLNEIVTAKTAYNTLSNTSFDIIDDAFNSISIVNFINKNFYNVASANIGSDYYNKLKAIYFFNKVKDSKTSYPATLAELGLIESDIKISNTNFYDSIFNQIINFPINYLNGEYGNHTGHYYSYDVRTITDELFNTYFTITDTDGTTHDPIGYITGVTNTDKQYYMNNLNIFYNNGTWDNQMPTMAEIESLFCGIISLNTNQTQGVTFNNITIDQNLITQLTEKLIECCAAVNEAVTLFNNMQMEFQFTENTTNLFDFIKTCIDFFISYTSTIYDSNLIYKIDTKNERIPITYKLDDKIENQCTDYLYYDEKCTIEEFVGE